VNDFCEYETTVEIILALKSGPHILQSDPGKKLDKKVSRYCLLKNTSDGVDI
jgi:hypothetical protein